MNAKTATTATPIDNALSADVAKRQAIERNNDELLAIPPNGMDSEAARQLAREDVSKFRGIMNAAERHFAAIAIGDNAKNQDAYKTELHAQAPDIAEEAETARAVITDYERQFEREHRKDGAWSGINAQTRQPELFAFVDPRDEAKIETSEKRSTLERFELHDPRDDTKYAYQERARMEAKADELGATRYQGYTAENEIIQYVKKSGKWQRQDSRAEEAKRLVHEFESRIKTDQQRDTPVPENLTPKVKAAFAEMGIEPTQETERLASIAIEARQVAYADAAIMAKYKTSEAGDKPAAEVITPEIAEQWAALDARDFRNLTDEFRIEVAAIFMMGNAKNNTAYKAALTSHTPDIFEKIAVLDAANNEKIVLKETRKAVDARNMADAMRIEPVALERVAARRGHENNAVREALGLNSEEANVDIGQKPARPAVPHTSDAAPPGNAVESDEVFTATRAARTTLVPPAIEKRYLRVGNTFYHPKNTDLVAFEDNGNKLETKSNSEIIAESMVQIAAARGWNEIKVSGSETFRKQAWLEAASRGMHIKGYSPSEQDKAELAKRVSETAANKIEKENKPFRARENDPERGSEIKDGRPNPWNVQLAKAFSNESAVDAVKKFPELAGSVATVAIIDKQAEAHGLTPEQRSIVSARVRQNVVNSIERGEIPEVKLRAVADARKEVNKEREYSR